MVNSAESSDSMKIELGVALTVNWANGGLEKVNVRDRSGDMDWDPLNESSMVLPWTIVTFDTVPSCELNGLRKTITFGPLMIWLVISTRKTIDVLSYGAKSPEPVRWLRPAGTSSTNWPLTRTFSWPTPLSKSSRSNPVKVKNALFPDEGATITVTLAVLESAAGAVPVVPVIVKVKVAGAGTAVQLTVRTVPDTLAVQPVGATPVENVRVPENPLIAVNDNVEVLGVPTTTLSEEGLADTEKSTTWKVADPDVTVCAGVPPLPVTVAA
jgi:hypothetical protein